MDCETHAKPYSKHIWFQRLRRRLGNSKRDLRGKGTNMSGLEVWHFVIEAAPRCDQEVQYHSWQDRCKTSHSVLLQLPISRATSGKRAVCENALCTQLQKFVARQRIRLQLWDFHEGISTKHLEIPESPLPSAGKENQLLLRTKIPKDLWEAQEPVEPDHSRKTCLKDNQTNFRPR